MEQRKENCIVQSNSSTPLTPAPHEQKAPVVQPPVERRDFSTDEDSASTPEPNTPWKPEKKINPNLLALKERLRKKAEDEQS